MIAGEIVAYAARVVRGFDFGNDDAFELVREGVGVGQFVGLPDTTIRFRELYHFPDLFRHWNVGRWRSEGSPSILGEAWTRAKEEIQQSTFQLDPVQRDEIERIYCKAEEYIRTRV